MALPLFGQISFRDFNSEQVLPLSEQTDMYTAALIYGVPFTTNGSDSISMDEFYNKEAPYYDVYNAFLPGPGDTYIAVPWSSGNPFDSSFGGNCFTKQTGPPGLKYGQVISVYPMAQFFGSAGPDCGTGGFEP